MMESARHPFLKTTLFFLGLILLVTGFLVWRMVILLPSYDGAVRGDGENVDSYGYNLEPLLVDKDVLVAAGIPKNGITSYDDPKFYTPQEIEKLNKEQRGKVLVSSDRVIGVSLGGESRAYPLRFMNLHEIVHDTVGGEPVAVTYNPLCDSAVVFSRRVGDEIREFGVSGLLYNSNLLMYDRHPEEESLWSQLLGKAIAGKAAEKGMELAIFPAQLTHWSRWLEAHPKSKVLAPHPAKKKQYTKISFRPYFGSEKLRFPVHPLPSKEDGLSYKSRIVALRLTDSWFPFAYKTIAEQCAMDGEWEVELEGKNFAFFYDDDPEIVEVRSLDDGNYDIIHSFWFAWYATHPEVDLVIP